MLGLSIAPGYPWKFVVLACVIIASSPWWLVRWRRNHWRLNLQALLAAIAIIGLLLVFVRQHIEAVHFSDRQYHIWINGLHDVEPTQEQLPNVEYSPVYQVIVELLFFYASIPLVLTTCVTANSALILAERKRRIRNGKNTNR